MATPTGIYSFGSGGGCFFLPYANVGISAPTSINTTTNPRIRGHARPRMPFDGPPYLSDNEVALVTDWVDQGARNSEGQRAGVPAGASVRLHGTLGADGRLDDLALASGTRVRRDGKAGAGDYVELRGRVQPDGSVQPLRIRRR